MNDNLIIAENIGLRKPTIVYYKGERLETVGLSIETLVNTWRERFKLGSEWIVLACSDKEYKAIQQRTISDCPNIQEVFYRQKVICINQKPIEDREINKLAAVLFESVVALEGTDFAFGVNGDDHFTRLAKKLTEAGYINGADFVEWLKMKLKQEQDNAGNVPSHALSICKGLERAIDIIDKSLQEYLKGERV